MIDATDIENDNYNTNDIADLLMRLQIASTALNYVATELSESDSGNEFVKRAHEVAANSCERINFDHECTVSPDDKGSYRCFCDLIASAE